MQTGSVAVVLGTRPEIIKLAHVIRILGPLAHVIYTGQHYDRTLSGAFFDTFKLNNPDKSILGVGGASRGTQVSAIVKELTAMFTRRAPSVVVVQGDTNSTLGGALAAECSGVPVVHVEAGLRSFDRSMPEEINRRLVGSVAALHCVPTPGNRRNLLAEGVSDRLIQRTGNTVVEATLESRPSAEMARRLLGRYELADDGYVLATIHRPENTDDPQRLAALLESLHSLKLPVVFPVHPRTQAAVRRHKLTKLTNGLRLLPPLDHPRFLALAAHARLLVSDSGGVQEEVTVLKKPLVVVRNSTERQEAVDAGFAVVVQPGRQLHDAACAMIDDDGLARRLADTPSPFGDGLASTRIATAVCALASTGVR